jgi:predicted DNA-binding transcriptional regulator YafY
MKDDRDTYSIRSEEGSARLGDGNPTNSLKLEAAERILRLLQFLLANECTRRDVFDHLALYYKIDRVAAHQPIPRSADKMFERDIRFLEDQGFEIQKIKKHAQPTRYHLVKGTGPSTAFLFTSQEVDSLALLYNMFADPTRYTQSDASQPLPQQVARHPFAEDMLALIEKLASTLPADQKEQFDRWVRKPYVYFNLSTVADYLPCRSTINTIVEAISLHQQLQFAYLPSHREQDVIFHEHIDPYYVTHLEGHFYLIGYNHKVSQFLEYRVDRIKEETLKREPNKIDVERRRRPIEFCFWLDGNIAKRGISQRWLTQVQEGEDNYVDKHGRTHRRVLIRATAYNEWRIIQQLLKYGDKAELVSPPHLREQMKQVVQRMNSFYDH